MLRLTYKCVVITFSSSGLYSVPYRFGTRRLLSFFVNFQLYCYRQNNHNNATASASYKSRTTLSTKCPHIYLRFDAVTFSNGPPYPLGEINYNDVILRGERIGEKNEAILPHRLTHSNQVIFYDVMLIYLFFCATACTFSVHIMCMSIILITYRPWSTTRHR